MKATPDLKTEICGAIRQVLQLHGGTLPASLLGDEMRRRHSTLWTEWKAKSDISLMHLCAKADGFSVVTPASPELFSHRQGSGAEVQQEPLVQLIGCEDFQSRGNIVNQSGFAKDSHHVSQEEVRQALAKRMLRHESHGASVPIAWLTVACEKELLRHIRLFPLFEEEIAQGSTELADLLLQDTGTVTSSTSKALRKKRMACRVVALLSEAKEVFEIEKLESKNLLEAKVNLLKPDVKPQQVSCHPQGGPETSVARPSRMGEGRRAWRRHVGAEMPRNELELTMKLQSLSENEAESMESKKKLMEVWLFLLRSQGSRSKEAQLMALEFEAAAKAIGARPEEIAPGMFVLQISSETPEAAFLQVAHHLTSVRRKLCLCCCKAFVSVESLAKGVVQALSSQRGLSWWLDVELREAPVNSAFLPLKHSHGAELVLQIIAKVAQCSDLVMKLQKDDEATDQSCPLQLVILEANGGAWILAKEMPDLQLELSPSLQPCSFPKPWHEVWSKRPFHFSAGLDSWVASAVISLVAIEFQGQNKRHPKTCLDPCCGSGTLAAVAAASGIFTHVFARDVDENFVQRSKENFAYVAETFTPKPFAEMNVDSHDATKPFSKIPLQPDVIVANPPWGWRIGLASSSAEDIALNLLHEFPAATVALVCPELPQLNHDLSFELRSSCPLGQSAVWILAPTDSGESGESTNPFRLRRTTNSISTASTTTTTISVPQVCPLLLCPPLLQHDGSTGRFA